MDLWNNVFVNPPFRNDPPLKINVTARTMGIIALVLGIIGALLWLALLPAIVFISNTACGVFNDCASYPLATVGVIVGIVGVVAQIIGGVWMMNGQVRGRALLVYALAIGVIGNLFVTLNYGGGTSVFGILVDLVVYYFLVIARFPGEAPLVTTPMGQPPVQPPTAPPAPPATPQG